MQINCYHCHNPMFINPAGGQVRCPNCGTVNAIGFPAPAPAQAQYGDTPLPKRDGQKSQVAMGCVALCVIALFVGWWAVGVGVVLLGWGIAGALGKVRGPLNLVFPESTRQTGLAALGVLLGAMVMTCGAMGMVARDSIAANIAQYNAEEAEEKAEQEVVEKAEQEVVAKAEKEEHETREAATKAAREAELRANAAEVAVAYEEGLDAVDGLIARESWIEAGAKLEVTDKLVDEHRKLSPVPNEIDALMPRRDALAATLELKLRERKVSKQQASQPEAIDHETARKKFGLGKRPKNEPWSPIIAGLTIRETFAAMCLDYQLFADTEQVRTDEQWVAYVAKREHMKASHLSKVYVAWIAYLLGDPTRAAGPSMLEGSYCFWN